MTLGRIILLIAALALLLAACSLIPAHAHDWYTGTKNENNQSCCGKDDCHPLAEGDVDEVTGGYFVKSRQLFVPYARTQASPDKRYHMCIVPWEPRRNDPRCFFAPVPLN